MPNVIDELVTAVNAHDVDRATGLFHPDYQSEQPAHPARGFTGRAQFHANWEAMFAGVPDFRSEVDRLAVDGDTTWVEWSWSGTRTDGQPFDMRGVCLFRVHEGLIVAGRLYMDEVEQASDTIDDVVHALAGTAPRQSREEEGQA
jgi:ketosteroid isomerase-like protein